MLNHSDKLIAKTNMAVLAGNKQAQSHGRWGCAECGSPITSIDPKPAYVKDGIRYYRVHFGAAVADVPEFREVYCRGGSPARCAIAQVAKISRGLHLVGATAGGHP